MHIMELSVISYENLEAGREILHLDRRVVYSHKTSRVL